MIESTYRYVYATLVISGSPPTGDEIRSQSSRFHFAPISRAGTVHTIDSDVWPARTDTTQVPETYIYPDANYLLSAIQGESTVVMALADQSSLIAWGANEAQPLTEAAPFLSSFLDSGYDVIDYSALSGLVNIGYSSKGVQEIESMQIATNGFGLIADLNKARMFAALASRVAPEHAPFNAVRIYMREHKPTTA
jgi:hypothetical protein